MKLVHVIIGLHVGGAETMLLKLLQGLDRTRFEPVVVALMDGGEISDQIQALDIPVHHLGMKNLAGAPGTLLKLRRLARELEPDLIQGWMYHGNLAATRLARWAPGDPVLFWNIRHTMTEHAPEKMTTRALIRLGGRWSGQARQVVHNSHLSVGQHEGLGFGCENSLVIPNGFDLEAFRPDADAGSKLRSELGLAADTVLVGTLGRHHPIKGLADFLMALAAMESVPPTAHFLCAGRDVTAQNAELKSLVVQTGFADRVHLLGPRSDAPEFLAGLDLFCLPSRAEGFPNALGEAMACGLPCVATDVGEATIMLEGLCDTVPPNSPAKLAVALDNMLAMPPEGRRALGTQCRERMAERYRLAAIVTLYEDMYASGVES